MATRKRTEIPQLRGLRTYERAYEKDPRAFRAQYTALRDIAVKRLSRMAKSGGFGSAWARSSMDDLRKLADLDRQAGEFRKAFAESSANRLYAHAMSDLLRILNNPRSTVAGAQKILQGIAGKLEAKGYGMFTGYRLEILGKVMERARQIWGRKFVPSDELVEMVGEGLGPELLRITNAQLVSAVQRWEGRRGLGVQEIV